MVNTTQVCRTALRTLIRFLSSIALDTDVLVSAHDMGFRRHEATRKQDRACAATHWYKSVAHKKKVTG